MPDAKRFAKNLVEQYPRLCSCTVGFFDVDLSLVLRVISDGDILTEVDTGHITVIPVEYINFRKELIKELRALGIKVKRG